MMGVRRMSRTAGTRLAALGAALFIAGMQGCTAPTVTGDPDSPLPAARHGAMSGLAVEPDLRQSARRLIEQLDHDDPAVRWRAASILESRTGQTLGYRYDDPPSIRREAVLRWVRWHESAFGTVESSTPPGRNVSNG